MVSHRAVRRLFSRLVNLVVLATVVGCVAGEEPSRDLSVKERPEAPEVPSEFRRTPRFTNLVLIVVDTLRSDHLPSYGYRRMTAPFLARLASEGIQAQGYSVSSWTRTSVATLLTGAYPQRHQTTTRADSLPSSLDYLPALLKEQGYETAGYAANATVGERFGFARGYDDFRNHRGDKHNYPPAAEVTAIAAGLLRNLRSPFFLYAHYLDPHDPYSPARPFGGELGEAETYPQPEDVLKGRLEATRAVIQNLIDQYDGTILETDRAIEDLFGALSDSGHLSDTLVVVTADHGEEFLEHGGLIHGRTLYQEVLRVPFIVWGDGLTPRQTPQAFHQVDFLPTVLEALGRLVPEGVDGRGRWQELVRGSLEEPGEMLFLLDLAGDAALAINRGSYKLIHQVRRPTNLLFDLENDTDEQTNLSAEAQLRSDLLHQLVARHNQLGKERTGRSVTTLDDRTRRQLSALGYMEVDTPQRELEARQIPRQLVIHDTRVAGLFAGAKRRDLARLVNLGRPSRQLLSGWLGQDPTGRWSGPSASFVLPLSPTSTTISFKGRSTPGRAEVRCVVRLNEQELGEFLVEPGAFEVALEIPPEARNDPLGYFELLIEPAMRLGPRKLFGLISSGPEVGLYWSEIGLR